MKKTVKVPQTLYRAMEVERKDGKVMAMSISSDKPYRRYDYWSDEYFWEVLDHGPGGCDEERLKAGLPILFNHKRDAHIARAGSYVNDGHKITVSDFVWASGQFAEEKKKDMESGALPDSSVGYELIDEGVCIGAKDEEPVYKFKFRIFEGSAVTIPADPSVGIGRERDHKPSGEPKEILVEVEEKNALDAKQKEANTETKPMKLLPAVRDHFRNKDDGGDPAAGASPKPVDEKKVRAEAIKAERERQKKIQDFVLNLKKLQDKDCSEIAAKYLTGECADQSFDDFRQEVLETSFKAAPVTQGNGRPSIEVIGERGEGPANGRIISVGSAFVNDEQYKSQRNQRRRNMSVNIPGMNSFRATAATTTITNFSGIVQIPNMIELGVQMATVADLLSGGTTNLNAVPFLQEDTITNAATTVAEGAAKPEASWDWSQVSAPVKKIAVISKVTDELFADVPTIESYINARMRWMVELQEDAQLLTGDGVGSNITGITATAGIQTQAKGADIVPDAVRKAMTKVQSIGFFAPDGAVFHPNDWEAISLLKDTAGQYLAGGPFYAPYGNGLYVQYYTIWGLRVVVTTSMTENTGLVGAFKLGGMIFRRSGLTIDSTNSNEDDFEKNLITLRAEERLALAVWRPKAFCTVTGI